jgi:cytochrome c55X
MRLLLICGLLAAGPAMCQQAVPARAAAASETSVARQQALIRIVRQDCGSCHGMRLTGGLGPALTREALAERPLDVLVASIVHGRPGTPMPGWKTLLSDTDATWIARQLHAGFPEEPKALQ